ncbi:hypothetical protein ACWDYJ_05195 [Streptomyces sp. NPDC003042]
MSVEQAAWEAALHHLHDNSFAYMATGAREHSDWRLDVLAVMNRAVPDARGWLVLDDHLAPEGGGPAEGSSYPFLPPSLEQLAEQLYEIDPEAAAHQLVAMTDDSCWLPRGLRSFAEGLDELLEMARTVLARFGPQFTCLTNVTLAYDNRNPDYSSSSLGRHAMSVYSDDNGLVVVSDTEVGVFWTFADY